jgi:protein TonB
MNRFQKLLSRMNGWALSLLLHVGLALLAGLSAVSVHLSGGNGNGSGGTAGAGLPQSYAATLHGTDEHSISGTVLPDVAQYEKLDDSALESVTEEPPLPPIPFDVFAVGASDPAPTTTTPQSVDDPVHSRPSAGDGRTVKLPAAGDGSQDSQDASTAGSNGAGDGDSDGKGTGEGTGEGNAVGIYTPSPPYPSDARRRNIEGSVLVELAISVDGSCSVRRILESSGFTSLDDAVQSTVLRWKYRPADVEGRSEISTKRLRFTFRLGQ